MRVRGVTVCAFTSVAISRRVMFSLSPLRYVIFAIERALRYCRQRHDTLMLLSRYAASHDTLLPLPRLPSLLLDMPCLLPCYAMPPLRLRLPLPCQMPCHAVTPDFRCCQQLACFDSALMMAADAITPSLIRHVCEPPLLPCASESQALIRLLPATLFTRHTLRCRL